MVYPKINKVLLDNIRLTKRFGGGLFVATIGKKAPKLCVTLDRESAFNVIMGKKIRVELAWGEAEQFFPRKFATQDEVVKALEHFFNLVRPEVADGVKN